MQGPKIEKDSEEKTTVNECFRATAEELMTDECSSKIVVEQTKPITVACQLEVPMNRSGLAIPASPPPNGSAMEDPLDTRV